jgi:hypothetical protein
VAHFDFKDNAQDGLVSVISSTGKLLDTITTSGSEISGICVR